MRNQHLAHSVLGVWNWMKSRAIKFVCSIFTGTPFDGWCGNKKLEEINWPHGCSWSRNSECGVRYSGAFRWFPRHCGYMFWFSSLIDFKTFRHPKVHSSILNPSISFILRFFISIFACNRIWVRTANKLGFGNVICTIHSTRCSVFNVQCSVLISGDSFREAKILIVNWVTSRNSFSLWYKQNWNSMCFMT